MSARPPPEFQTPPGHAAHTSQPNPPPPQIYPPPNQPNPPPHQLYPPAPQGYSHPSQVNISSPSTPQTNIGQATGKAGAYGGSELGSLIGGAVGPPIIGNIVGNLVGERVGEKVIKDTGIGDKVTEAGDQLAGVIGRRNVNKLGDMTMTAFGYSDQEVCVCCPCLPASQVLLFTTVPFYFFNLYKIGLGVSWQSSCSTEPPNDPDYRYNVTDNVTDIYPCEYGFYYLTVSSAVWLAFLPFWITALFGNCWRQCCCCCCDPIVLCGTIIDFIKRCCCECGKFNCCELIWYSHCIFHLAWAFTGLAWVAGLPVTSHSVVYVAGWEVPRTVWDTVLASVVLDLLLAGSEVFHRVRLHRVRNKQGEEGDGGEKGEAQPINQPGQVIEGP